MANYWLAAGIAAIVLIGVYSFMTNSQLKRPLTTPAPEVNNWAQLLALVPQCDHSYRHFDTTSFDTIVIAKDVRGGPWYGYHARADIRNATEMSCVEYLGDNPLESMDSDGYYSIVAGTLTETLNLTGTEFGTMSISGFRVLTDRTSSALMCGDCWEGDPVLAIVSNEGGDKLYAVLAQLGSNKTLTIPFDMEGLCVYDRDPLLLKDCVLYLPVNNSLPTVLISFGDPQKKAYWFNTTPTATYHQLFSNSSFRQEFIDGRPDSAFKFNETHFCETTYGTECIHKLDDKTYIRLDLNYSSFEHKLHELSTSLTPESGGG